jgi:hypothetical protein
VADIRNGAIRQDNHRHVLVVPGKVHVDAAEVHFPSEDLDNDMAGRPTNRSSSPRSVFEHES